MRAAIDCDIHPGVPDIHALLRYMEPFWQDSFVQRGLDGFDMMSYPLNAPITCRPDWRVTGPASRRQPRCIAHAGAGRIRHRHGHLQSADRRPGFGQRNHGRRDLLRGQRLDAARVAGQGTSPARVDRRAGAGAAAGGRGNRSLRRRPPLRPGPVTRRLRNDARPLLLLADLSGSRTPWPADRNPRRQHVSVCPHRHRMAVTLCA